MDFESDSVFVAKPSGGGGGGGGAGTWTKLWSVDFRTEPAREFTSAGKYTLGGKDWYFRPAGLSPVDQVHWAITAQYGLTWWLDYGYGGSPGDFGYPGNAVEYPHWVMHLDQLEGYSDAGYSCLRVVPPGGPSGCAAGFVSTPKNTAPISAADRVYDAFVARYANSNGCVAKFGDQGNANTQYFNALSGMAVFSDGASKTHFAAGSPGAQGDGLPATPADMAFSGTGYNALQSRAPTRPRPSPAICLMPFNGGHYERRGIPIVELWKFG